MLLTLLLACGPGHQDGEGANTPGTPPTTAESKAAMLQNKGSDTMVNLAQAWAEEYRKVKPTVAIAVSGGGSGTGIAALENGTVDLANASREIKAEEHELIVKNSGGKHPIEHTVAFDALAIYVHKDNPIASINKAQLAAIYGEKGTVTKWTDIGVTVPGCADQEIVRISRQSNSGTYDYFREWTLGKDGDFKLGSRDMQGSKDVADIVTQTPCAIGFSGMGYLTDELKAACVAVDDTTPCAVPTQASVLDKSYPISRGLYIYTVGEATGDAGSYLQWIMSDAGQTIVEKAGFVPLPADQRKPIPAG